MKQFFYVFDEHTDLVKECSKIGMQPSGKYYISEYSNQIYAVSEFLLDDTKYILLSHNECCPIYEIVLMALPSLNYNELINLIETSRIYDEMIGCISVLLKQYTEKFANYLFHNRSKSIKKIKKIILKEIGTLELDDSMKSKLKIACEF